MHIIDITGNPNYNHSIKLLYSLGFDRDINIDALRNWYNKSNYHVIEYGLLEDNNVIVYNYFFCRTFNNLKIAMSGGSVVHPEYKGSFFIFYKKLQNYLLENNVFLYAFLNKYSYQIFFHKRGFAWTYIENFKQVKLLQRNNSNVVNTENIKECNLSELEVEDYMLQSIDRNNEWIKWRIFEHPFYQYYLLKYENKYCIYKKYNNYVDLLTIINCKSYYDYFSTLEVIFDYFLLYGFKLNLIISSKSALDLLNKTFSYEEEEYNRWLGVKLQYKILDFEPSSFFVEMIDSDTY